MNITSLLITLAGIIVILALYLMSRITQSKLPQKNTSFIPNLKDENGDRFTSVLDDIPARDGSNPTTPSNAEKIDEPQGSEEISKEPAKSGGQTQHILFISGQDEKGLDGNLVQQGLEKNGLVFGDNDIYHYLVDTNSGSTKTSLFRVANGIEPWTLKSEDLLNKKLAGLSIVMLTPSQIDDEKAMNTFITVTENICKAANGILKNQQQQVFTQENRDKLLKV